MKKIIDKNGRLFGVISIIDVAVLLVVAVMALALYVRGNRSVTGTTLSDELISFQMVIEVAPDYLAESVQVGDFIYDKERVGAGALGEIKKVELLPPSKPEIYLSGDVLTTGGEDCYNVLITAQGKGIIADGRFTLNRVYTEWSRDQYRFMVSPSASPPAIIFFAAEYLYRVKLTSYFLAIP